MGKTYEKIDAGLREFLAAQPLFFAATAPLDPAGHVNVSPKGMSGCFAVLGEHRVAYLDYTGSGAESIAHLRENGRVTLMFCAFDGRPKIVRLHGRGRIHLPGSAEFDALKPQFVREEPHGLRAIIDVEVTRISSSCGFAVPRMDFVEDRDMLDTWAAKRDDAQLVEYRAARNAVSIDGLPGYQG